MIIYDCTAGAWVYATEKMGVASINDYCAWTIWQPQYGYYWTLFIAYDKDGNEIERICYPFVNIC